MFAFDTKTDVSPIHHRHPNPTLQILDGVMLYYVHQLLAVTSVYSHFAYSRFAYSLFAYFKMYHYSRLAYSFLSLEKM